MWWCFHLQNNTICIVKRRLWFLIQKMLVRQFKFVARGMQDADSTPEVSVSWDESASMFIVMGCFFVIFFISSDNDIEMNVNEGQQSEWYVPWIMKCQKLVGWIFRGGYQHLNDQVGHQKNKCLFIIEMYFDKYTEDTEIWNATWKIYCHHTQVSSWKRNQTSLF